MNEDLIRARWPDAATFYHERDHRTGLLIAEIERYATVPVEIRVDPRHADDATTQATALVAANLTARWARRVLVVTRDAPLRGALEIGFTGGLAARLLAEMRSADPFGDFAVAEGADAPPGGESLRLFVGPWREAVGNSGADYHVDAAGWSARGRRLDQPLHSEPEPGLAAAAALAGAIGAGDLLKRAVGHPPGHWMPRFAWSLWSHECGSQLQGGCPTVPNPADIGRVLLAGVGAIGSALLYILLLDHLAGEFTVLDRDGVDTTNLNRSPLFTAEDAAVGRHKADVALAVLASRGLRATPRYGRWHEHAAALSLEPFDVWVSLTNEEGAWAAVPFQLPPVVVHGTTTSEWGVAAGRHIPRLEDCTLCRLPRPQAEFRGPCGDGTIAEVAELDTAPRASLPFLSTVAAALVAAELIKLPLRGAASQPNCVQADFRYGLPAVIGVRRSPSTACNGCKMASLPLWSERGGRGRYAHLSEQPTLVSQYG
jgi:ThiF family protein